MKVPAFLSSPAFGQRNQPYQNIKVSGVQTPIAKEDEKNKDTVTISSYGRKRGSILENLAKQKQLYVEKKNELLVTAKEKKLDYSAIKETLKSYDQQIRTIEQQMSQEIKRQAEEQTERVNKTEEDKPLDKEAAKLEEENELLSGIVDVATDFSQLKVVQSVKVQAKVDASTIKTEVLNTVNGATSQRLDALSKAESKFDSLTTDFFARAVETTQKLDQQEEALIQDLQEKKEEEEKDPLQSKR